MKLISKIWWVTKHWLPNFWNKNQNGNNLCKINLVGWNIIWDESQFGMSKNYSHFLWIWRVLHIFPTSCYGSGCELPKCLNYFHAKLLQDWTLTFLFVQSSHSEFCCFLHESLTKETMRVVDSECPTPHIFLIEGIHTFSSKTWCLIWIAAWEKMQK